MRALDADGSQVLGVGTVVSAVATLLGWLWRPELDAAGRGWWWWVAMTATGLGALGWAGVRLRRRG